MAKDTSGQALDSRLFEVALSEQERALRDNFVNEYMKDFDPFHAALRCGFLVSFAIDWGKKLLSESYVQRRITELTRRASESVAEQDASDKALIENTLRQAMQHGQYASRVAAARAFAEMKGLAKPDAGADSEQTLIDLFKDFAQKVPV